MSISMSKTRVALLAALACGYAACERSPATGPGELFGNETEFFAPATFSEMQDNARSSGSLRVEIDLIDGSLVASHVTIQVTDAARGELIDSRITGMSVDGSTGAITVALGDLVVGFNGDTKFVGAEGNEISQEAFVAAVEESRAAGLEPAVQASRPAPEPMQAPDDGTFLASEIRLAPEEDDASMMVMYLGLDNLIRNDAPPPDAWINILNLLIEIRVSDGTTELDFEKPEFDKIEFEGVVESVDLESRSFKLVGGAVIRLVDNSKIHFEPRDDHHLATLEAVAEAIARGEKVVAHGVGVLESEDPRTIVAMKLRFAIRFPPMERFHGKVESIDLAASTFKLIEGPVVRVDANTKIYPPDNATDLHHLSSLEAAARALEAGKIVEAAGHGVIESDAAGAVQILARVLVLEVELPPMEGFEGIVESVDVENGTIQIVDGPLIQITDETKILATEADDWRLNDLKAVAAAINEGKTVIVHGRGFITSEEPLVIEAVGIAFYVQPPDLTEFEGTVESVDAEAGSLTLVGGQVILIDEETRFKLRNYHFAHEDIPVLDIVQRVMGAGISVGVSGAGVADGEAIVAVLLVFHFDFVGEIGFEGQVVGVNMEAQTFKLANDLTVYIVDNITIDVAGDMANLAAVAEALAAGTTVHAVGRAVLVVEGELVKPVAVYVKFSR